jgi:hypothetical protein
MEARNGSRHPLPLANNLKAEARSTPLRVQTCKGHARYLQESSRPTMPKIKMGYKALFSTMFESSDEFWHIGIFLSLTTCENY